MSLRLNAILNMIDNKDTLIDVGCDHALLDIEALRLKKVKKALAIDINEKALDNALRNIEKLKVKNITLLNADGLNNIDVYENDIVVISGLGTRTIKHILFNKDVNEVIIQSNNDIFELRKFMNKKYLIKDEKVIKEKGIYYVIIYYIKGKKKYSLNELLFGPFILKDEKEYLIHLRKKYTKIYDDIPKKYFLKKHKYKLLIKLLNKNI